MKGRSSRPVRRDAVGAASQAPNVGAVGGHRVEVVGAGSVRREDEMAAVGGPPGVLVVVAPAGQEIDLAVSR